MQELSQLQEITWLLFFITGCSLFLAVQGFLNLVKKVIHLSIWGLGSIADIVCEKIKKMDQEDFLEILTLSPIYLYCILTAPIHFGAKLVKKCKKQTV